MSEVKTLWEWLTKCQTITLLTNIDRLPWLPTDFISYWGVDIVDKYIYSATISGKTFLQKYAPEFPEEERSNGGRVRGHDVA
jgi:hypothetical protein